MLIDLVSLRARLAADELEPGDAQAAAQLLGIVLEASATIVAAIEGSDALFRRNRVMRAEAARLAPGQSVRKRALALRGVIIGYRARWPRDARSTRMPADLVGTFAGQLWAWRKVGLKIPVCPRQLAKIVA